MEENIPALGHGSTLSRLSQQVPPAKLFVDGTYKDSTGGTLSEHIPNTSQTHSEHIPNTFQTHPKRIPIYHSKFPLQK
jgi:hypothetical protein